MAQPGSPCARCLIQPRIGRVFVVLPDRIYILSTFQEPAITAWAMFDAPFNFTHAVVSEPYVMLRGSDNVIYTLRQRSFADLRRH